MSKAPSRSARTPARARSGGTSRPRAALASRAASRLMRESSDSGLCGLIVWSMRCISSITAVMAHCASRSSPAPQLDVDGRAHDGLVAGEPAAGRGPRNGQSRRHLRRGTPCRTSSRKGQGPLPVLMRRILGSVSGQIASKLGKAQLAYIPTQKKPAKGPSGRASACFRCMQRLPALDGRAVRQGYRRWRFVSARSASAVRPPAVPCRRGRGRRPPARR